VTNGAQLIAGTRGQGDAGSVIILARDTVSFDGVGYGLNTEYEIVELPSAALSTVESQAVGNGGGINITAGSLSVTDAASLSTSSEGSGAAGSIEVAASSIRLESLALLSADTPAGQGNIILHSGELVLRRGSNITTDATGTATGGNITIDTDVLVALENSDITANASEGPGGRVIIDAFGIFGTQFRAQRTPQSDITATSNLGPQLSGTVEINTPDVDPSQGLATLPAEVVDASGLIASSCGAGGRQGESEFIVTGRGGLPPTPNDTLSAEAVLADWATLEPEKENRYGAQDTATNPTSAEPTQIVEAQGWIIDDKGSVVLTASAPTVTSDIPWLTQAYCHAPKTSS
jgi:large exoprotein involved in heme utilization and adhesion